MSNKSILFRGEPVRDLGKQHRKKNTVDFVKGSINQFDILLS